MPLIAPLALAGLAFIPLVIAFYLLKLRRDEHVVPSTLLWQRLVADVEANAPWQRLRRSLLLLLQLLLVAVLAVLAARPFVERPAGLARDIVLVIDTSASMGATDVVPNRLEAAKRAALDALRDLPSGGSVSVIAAGSTARVIANGTTDLGRIRQAIGDLVVEPAAGDLADALRLAGGLASRVADAEIVVATDAAIARPPDVRVDAPVKVLQVGRGRRNQAIVALAVRTAPSSVTRSVFVSVANLDLESADRRLEIWGDGRLLEARDVKLDPLSRSDVGIDDLPRDVSVVEVRLVGAGTGAATAGGDGTAAPDDLAVDDRAWAIVPPDRLRRVLLVGAGDPYLSTALSYLPDTEVYGVAPEAYGPATHPELFDLIVFEGTLPAELPRTAILAVDPPSSSPLGEVVGALKEPAIGTLDPEEPVLHFVDLSTTHIAAARKLVLPAWARTIVPGPGGAPLLYAGQRAGLRTAVLSFAPRQSDLPLQVAFPLLISNLAGELMGGSGAPPTAIAPATPVELAIPAGAIGLRVTAPDGSTTDLVPATPGAATITFSGTGRLGVYEVRPTGDQASPSPSADGSPGDTAAPLSSPSASSPDATAAASVTAPPVDPNAPVRFAVDLFSVEESTITPGSAAAIVATGSSARPSTDPGASASPATSASPGASVGPATGAGPIAPRAPARDELWGPLLLAVLGLLLVEWAVYERDGLVRIRRAIGARLPRRRAA